MIWLRELLAEHDDDQLLGKRRITLQLPNDVISWIDRFRREWGYRSRGDTVERLLRELFVDQQQQDDLDDEAAGSTSEESVDQPGHRPAGDLFDEAGALVLVSQARGGELGINFERADELPTDRFARRRSTGIDLPGFVRRQSEQLKQAVQPQQTSDPSAKDTFAVVDQQAIGLALDAARQHWHTLYGTQPNAAVLEAAMVWLSREIWPQIDQTEGRPFTWTLACRITSQLAPSWPESEPTFERVMVMAGLLEDPYSADTLSLRIPTLIRRFVHKFRKRQKGTSFETLANTMSLHGALKLLHLPTTPGHRLTLADIREAYREQALEHHPDSGGSAEQMRRLNEAYQMLKELYRANQ